MALGGLDTRSIPALETAAANHRRAIRDHRQSLRIVCTRIDEMKHALESVGITNGEAEKGDQQHGPTTRETNT